MDSLRGFDEDSGWSPHGDDEPAIERPPSIGFDERRMHVRAYNHWVSLLDGRPYPSIEDLKPEKIGDFGPHSVLLDFTDDRDDPVIAFLGTDLKAECGIDFARQRISEVPARSLLSRLTDHYMQIIANHAPIGFEAEFLSHRGINTLYRGILMPLSSNGDEIDFIYGVINWKDLADNGTANGLASAIDRAIAKVPERGDLPVWADGPNAEHDDLAEIAEQRDGSTLSLWPDSDRDDELGELPDDAALADRLGHARAGAEYARSADHRSRTALYRALGLAYDFSLAADAAPDEYAELLDDAGLKAQQRAPMTPLIKLIFGSDYDKTRVTEFAAALSWARRSEIEIGGFAQVLERFDGGLKGIVAAERAARRPEPKPDRAAERRARLQAAPVLALVDGIDAGGAEAGEIVLLVARKESDGSLAVLAPALRDSRLVDSAIARASD
ncbi:MAG: hypothetical protein ACK4SZ_01750 [Allosphingosinicella sp.]|uniref:PAS domain-containing protein n=1 Tax=Allosphingosinicella sp. TaxID=2823234 RepID=UPI0039480241